MNPQIGTPVGKFRVIASSVKCPLGVSKFAVLPRSHRCWCAIREVSKISLTSVELAQYVRNGSDLPALEFNIYSFKHKATLLRALFAGFVDALLSVKKEKVLSTPSTKA